MRLSLSECFKLKTERVEISDEAAFFEETKANWVDFPQTVEMLKSLEDTIDRSVMIIGRLVVSVVHARNEMAAKIHSSTSKDLSGIQPSRTELLNDFEHEIVACLVTNTTSCVWSNFGTNTARNETKKFRWSKKRLLKGFVNSRIDQRFAVEVNNLPFSLCKKMFSRSTSQYV